MAKKEGGGRSGGEPKSKRAKKVDPTEFPEAEDGKVYDLGNEWKYLAPGLIFKNFGLDQSKACKKLAAFDLDGTLIRNKSDRAFSINSDDWTPFNGKVFKIVQKFHDEGYRIVIFSNQAGISKKVKGKQSATIRSKIDKIDEALRKKEKNRFKTGGLSFPFAFFCAPKKDEEFRKPESGMFTYFMREFNEGLSASDLDLKASFFCGDMAGREGDRDVTDKQFAEKCGLAFKTPEELFGEGTGKAVVAKREGDNQENYNEELCGIFLQISEGYKKNNNNFKARAYSKVAETLKNYHKKLEGKTEAMKLSGIGKSIGEKVEEYVKTGKIALLQELSGSMEETKKQAEKLAEEKEKGTAFAFLD